MPDEKDINRAFIAIPLSDSWKEYCTRLIKGLSAIRADVRWARADSIHLTLKFLGPVEQDRYSKLKHGLGEERDSLAGFSIAAGGIGCFPRPSNPRILWLGVDGGEALMGLQSAIERVTARAGYRKERRKFHPHLTLGRFRSRLGAEEILSTAEGNRPGAPGDMRVGCFRLYESVLKPMGAEYSVLEEYELKGGPRTE